MLVKPQLYAGDMGSTLTADSIFGRDPFPSEVARNACQAAFHQQVSDVNTLLRHSESESEGITQGWLQENSLKKSEKEANQVETRRKISYQKCSGQPHEYLFSSASFVCSAQIFLSVYLLFSSLSLCHNDGQ